MTKCEYCDGPTVTKENILGTYWRCENPDCQANGWFQRADGETTVSYSEISSARRCPLQHQLGYFERWRKPSTDNLSPSSIGTAWHRVLEVHYNVLKELQQEPTTGTDDTLWVASAEVDRFMEDNFDYEMRELLVWMYEGYVAEHGTDEEWKILGVEVTGEVRLRPEEAQELDDPKGFWLKYKADLLIEYQGKIWIVDHKSYRNAPTNLDLDFDSQFDLYAWAFRQQGTPVFGQIYNGARRFRTQKPQPVADRHVRHMTHRSDHELDIIARDAYLTMRSRYAEQGKFDSLGITESPRHVDSRGCNHLCDFKEACLLGRKGVPLRDNLTGRGFVQNFERH